MEMKSYFRFLRRNPYYTIINILGLSVALMFVITIGDYTWRQLGVDSYHENADQIYLVGSIDQFISWPEEARQAGETIPEIESSCAVISTAGTISTEGRSINAVEEPSILLADTNFFTMFNYPFIEGNPEDALSSPDKCVVTQSLANELFPDCDPVGQPLRLIGERAVYVNDGSPDPYDSTAVYTVSAVIKDLDRTVLPNNTQVVANMQRHPQILGYRLSGMNLASSEYGSCKTFYQIRKDADIDNIADALNSYFKEHIYLYDVMAGLGKTTLTPLRKVMYAPQNVSGGLEKGDKRLLIILLCAISAILIFAVTNYINLTVANNGMRAKEMATRCLLGSSRRAVTIKFIIEGILMVLVAFLIGLVLSFLLQDKLSTLFRGKILIQNDINALTVTICVAFVLSAGLLSGLIPGLLISSVTPIDVVKGRFRYKSKMVFSRVFTMVQNLVTVVMLALALVMTLQVRGLVNAPLGVNSKDLVLVANAPGTESVIKERLGRLPCVEKIGTEYGTCPLGYMTSMNFNYDRDGNSHIYYFAYMDQVAFDIYGFEVLRGNGSETYYTRQFLRELNLDLDAEEIEWKESTETITRVIGDIHNYGSVLNDVIPLVITVKDPTELRYPHFIVKTDGSRGAVARINEALSDVLSDKLDDDSPVVDLEKHVYDNFEEQRNTLHIIYMFTGLALLLSIFGFIGLSLFFIRQRRNEIATRRIMGGSVRDVIILILIKFCAPLLISCALAVPIAYIVSARWLQSFSWRIPLSPWIFVAACLASLLIAVLSILWQTVSAVRRNPSEAIKSE